MSRARPIGNKWFDIRKNGEAANVDQLELLAAAENLSLDDLLDEGLSQGQLILRLRAALGEGIIPPEVLERRRARKEQIQPVCVICEAKGWECEGYITRHHFVPRWLMKELENYQAYASRAICTIPICVGRHRDLHYRDEKPKSIVKYLTDAQRDFAQKLLDELKDQHPKIFDLIAGGDRNSYEAQLIHDYQRGELTKSVENPVQVRAMAEG